MHKSKTKNNLAFTIVELLIVIVIIGILAAITIVSYRGITQRSIDATIQADLSNASKKLKMYHTLYNVYPTNMQPSDGNRTYCPTGPSIDVNYCIRPSNGNVFTYSQLSAGQDFSLTATKGNISYVTTKDISPTIASTIGLSFAKLWGSATGEEEARDLIRTSDGGYATAGYTTSFGAGGFDIFLSKFDSNGNLSWSKTWGGAGTESAYGLVQAADGGFIVSGSTSYGAGYYDVALLKFDATGNLSWSKTWGGTGQDEAFDLIKTADGGYAATGWVASYGAGSLDALLLKYDANGNLSWNKTWGGSGDDRGYEIVQAADGGYVITGWTNTFGGGNGDAYIAKFDVSGNLSWNKTLGGTGNDCGDGVIQASDGGYVLVGYVSSYGAGSIDAFFAKYNASGDLLWTKTWGGIGNDYFRSIIKTDDNGYIVSGTTSSYGAGSNDIILSKYNINGDLLWNKTWGEAGYELSNDIIQSNDNDFLVSGRSDSHDAGSNNALLLKFKSDGSMSNCVSPMCQSPIATITTPSAGVVALSASVSTPSATITSPAATVTTPTAIVTTVVAP